MQVEGVVPVNRDQMAWLSTFLAIGVIFVLVGFALWFPLFLVGPPWFSYVESQRFFSLPLLAAGFFFLVMSWFAASGESGRVLGVCLVLGILSISISTILSMVFTIDVMVYDFVIMAAFGLIGGSVFAAFYRSIRVRGSPARAR
jgi:hypothetical protein